MDAHEALGEFLLQRYQRFLDQVLPLPGSQGDVFLLGSQENDVAHRHEHDPVALGDRQVLARAYRHARQLLAPRRRPARGFAQRRRQPLGAHRLEKIVERVELERLQRVALVGGHENHRRRLLERHEVARHFQAADTRHLDVQQKDLGAACRHGLERLQAVARLAHDFGRDIRGDVSQQLLHALARRRLVIGNEYAQRRHAVSAGASLGAPARYGISISTR